MSRPALRIHPGYRQLLLVLIVAIGMYVLLPQFGSFRTSWELVRHPDISGVLVAVALTLGTYVAAAATYRFLSFKPLALGRTVLVQLAGMFVNRLVPAGLGALGINYLYLKRQHHTTAQALTVAGMNNLIGIVGHGLLLAAAILFAGKTLDRPIRQSSNSDLILELAGALAVAMVIAALVFGRRRLAAVLRDVRKQVLSYRLRPWSLAGALSTSMLLTACNVLCLYVCLHALGLSLPLPVVLVVFTLGVSAGEVVPTPGGLGGFEAGLAAGFVAYGIDPSQALATAILYRLVSYWLPIVAGLISFIAAERLGLFTRPRPA